MIRRTAPLWLAFSLSVATGWAHHSFAAEFDGDKRLHLTGVVVRFEFMNPHGEIDLNTSSGEWQIETSSPAVLLRRGVSKFSLAAGMRVEIDAYAAKDHSRRAYGLDVILPDGQTLYLNPPRN